METAIYGRVSTEEQALEGYSIRGQVEKLQSYVSAKSWSIYDVYLDEGISGKNITERPAVTRMIEDIKAGYVKNVLVYKLDRLTRSVADLVYLIDLFKKYDCAFNSLSESIDTSTASGRMFIKIIGIFAEFERENIGERVRLGKERKAREGYATGVNISYGYDREIGEKVQTINETEAAIVRRAFDMYVNQNISLTGIAKAFNAEKIPTKLGSTWNSGTVIAMLKNPNYIGLVRYGIEQPERYFEAEGKHEAIISEDIYQKAQILMDKKKAAAPTKQPAAKNYFAGILYCGLCGKKLLTHNTTQRGSRGNRLVSFEYECFQKDAGICTAKALTASKFERALIEYFTTLDITPDAEQEKKAADAKKAALAQIKALKKKISLLDAKEKEILDSYIEDCATLKEYRGVKVQLDVERARILAEIKRITPTEERRREGAASKEDIISIFRAEWGGYSDTEKRQFLVWYIRKIAVINQPVQGKRQGIYKILEVEYNTY